MSADMDNSGTWGRKAVVVCAAAVVAGALVLLLLRGPALLLDLATAGAKVLCL